MSTRQAGGPATKPVPSTAVAASEAFGGIAVFAGVAGGLTQHLEVVGAGVVLGLLALILRR